MRDDDHRALRRAQPVDAVGDDLQRVDVEAGIGLVEHGEPRLQQRHLQNLVALLLAAGKADIDARGAASPGRCRAWPAVSRTSLMNSGVDNSALAARLALRVERGAQERHGGDARHFHRILEGQEHALGGALVRRHAEDVLAVEQHLAFGDLVVVLAGQHIGERRLAGAVRPHDGGDLALFDGEVEAVEDLLALDLDVQVLDFKQRHFVHFNSSVFDTIVMFRLQIESFQHRAGAFRHIDAFHNRSPTILSSPHRMSSNVMMAARIRPRRLQACAATRSRR